MKVNANLIHHWRGMARDAGFRAAFRRHGLFAVLFSAWVFFLPSTTVATQQLGDTLEIDGAELAIEETPLVGLYTEDQLRQKIAPKSMCSANWRGYRAKWGIKGGALYLLELRKDVCIRTGIFVPSHILFTGRAYPISANWFSGRITSPTGRNWGNQQDKDGGAVTIRRERKVFEFRHGVLTRRFIEIVSSQ